MTGGSKRIIGPAPFLGRCGNLKSLNIRTGKEDALSHENFGTDAIFVKLPPFRRKRRHQIKAVAPESLAYISDRFPGAPCPAFDQQAGCLARDGKMGGDVCTRADRADPVSGLRPGD